MQIGYIGLGKMGCNMIKRLSSKNYKIIAYDNDEKALKKITRIKANKAHSLEDLTEKLDRPRLIWLMIPHHSIDNVLAELHVEENDTVIDGGNSFYKDSIRRAKMFGEKGINLLDVGVSGGPKGALNGSCLMIGGKKKVFESYEHLFRDLARENGYLYVGKSGTGHFAKMVHNGIEYGMMQAIAEGFDVLFKSPFDVNLRKIAYVYGHGSVIESRLIHWIGEAFMMHGSCLKEVCSKVESTGEGKWFVETAKEYKIKAQVIENSLQFRLNSNSESGNYQGKVVTALRNRFGGHRINSAIEKKKLK